MFREKRFRILLALAWISIVSVLFFTPGSAFPKQNWFQKVYLDKWVHVGIFFTLAIAWLWAMRPELKRSSWFLLLLLALYGFAVEVIQGLYVENRSFDLFDLASDIAGSVVGVIFWWRYRKK